MYTYHVLETEPYSMIVHVIYAGDGGFGLDFLRGHLIDPPADPDQLFVKIESKRADLPEYFEAGCIPIVTGRFLEVLKSCGVDNFQAFPVEIRFEDGTVNGYYVMNVIGRISCIDKDASDATRLGPAIMRLRSLKFRADFTDDIDMFRAHEYQTVIFISDRVKKAIEDTGITGALIKPADGWGDAHRF